MLKKKTNRPRDTTQTSTVLSLIEQAEQGTLPADIFRALIYGQEERIYSLTEETLPLYTPEQMTQAEEFITALTAAQVPFAVKDHEDTDDNVIITWPDEYDDLVRATMETLSVEPEPVEESESPKGVFVPKGERPVKKLPQRRKQHDTLSKYSRMSQAAHAKGRHPIDPNLLPTSEPAMSVQELIQSVLNGDSATEVVNSVCEAISQHRSL